MISQNIVQTLPNETFLLTRNYFCLADNLRDTLELVIIRRADEKIFAGFFSALWDSFAQSYVEGWVTSMDVRNPVTGASKVTMVSYSVQEEYDLHPLRVAVHRFLRALCFKPVPIDASYERKEQNEFKTHKIQIPFVKIICFIARQTQGCCDSILPFSSPVVVAHRLDNDTYHASCLVCPKLDRLEMMTTVDSGVQKASFHMLSYHERARIPLRRLRLNYRKRSGINISLEQYLVKLQAVIASSNRSLAVLELRHEEFWFENSLQRKKRQRIAETFR